MIRNSSGKKWRGVKPVVRRTKWRGISGIFLLAENSAGEVEERGTVQGYIEALGKNEVDSIEEYLALIPVMKRPSIWARFWAWVKRG